MRAGIQEHFMAGVNHQMILLLLMLMSLLFDHHFRRGCYWTRLHLPIILLLLRLDSLLNFLHPLNVTHGVNNTK